MAIETIDEDFMSEGEVIEVMGNDRYWRLRDGGWLAPLFEVLGYKGRPAYSKHYVNMRLAEDRRLHPEKQTSAVVTKSHSGGCPARTAKRRLTLSRSCSQGKLDSAVRTEFDR